MTKTSNHGITRVRGEDQPADKERAQLAEKIELGHTPPVVRKGPSRGPPPGSARLIMLPSDAARNRQ